MHPGCDAREQEELEPAIAALGSGWDYSTIVPGFI